MKSKIKPFLALAIAVLLLCSTAMAVGAGVRAVGTAAANRAVTSFRQSDTGTGNKTTQPRPSTPSSSKQQPATNDTLTQSSSEGDSSAGLLSQMLSLIENLFKPQRADGAAVRNKFAEIKDAINFGFNSVENTLRDSGNYPFIDGSAIVGTISGIMMPVGLLVFLICWGLQVMRSGLELDLYDAKHLIKMGLEFVAGLMLVTVAPQFCQLITAVSNNISADLLNTVSVNYGDIAESLPGANIDDYVSDVPVVGFLIQCVNFLWALPSIALYNLIVLITAGIMMFSLGIRVIKLTIYQGFAPLFIATGVNQDTKRFCINFLATYVLLSLQLVVMTVVYAMFRTSFAAFLASSGAISASFSWKGALSGGVFMIIYAVIMVKSDRLFDKVLH